MIENKLAAAQETHSQGVSLAFFDYIPADLPAETPNATDFLEAATMISHGQGHVLTPRGGPLSPEGKAPLELLRERDGHYPESLSDLGGETPIDPFSGTSYLYRPKRNGYVLYSVSVNGIDDGGVVAPADPRTKNSSNYLEGDFVWRVRAS